MKKILLLLTLISVFSCKKKDETPIPEPTGTCVIYSSNTSGSLPVRHIFDCGTSSTNTTNSQDIGVLKPSNSVPACGDTAFTTITRSAGTYYFVKKINGVQSGSAQPVTIQVGQCVSLNLH